MTDDTKEEASNNESIHVMDGETVIGLYDPYTNPLSRRRGWKGKVKEDIPDTRVSTTETDQIDANQKSQPNYSCPACTKSFASKSNLQIHMTIHTGQRYSCSVCKKCFTQKCNLKRHEITHLGTKSFSCVRCSKKFTQKANLQRHFVIHSGKRLFSCEECGKMFIQKCNLQKHSERHGEKTSFPFVECVLDEEGRLASEEEGEIF